MTSTRVIYQGQRYHAVAIAHGAAFELLTDTALPGSIANPRHGSPWAYRKFVHVTHLDSIEGIDATAPLAEALTIPLIRALDWTRLHQASQTTASNTDPLLRHIRASIQIRTGTRMMRVLSANQVAACLHGQWLPHGFCYREYDVAHLRAANDLSIIGSRNETPDSPVYVLRWPAEYAEDFHVPTADTYPGLLEIAPADRVGPPVLGTGFTPSGQHLIPEYVTADLADLHLPAYAEIIAYTTNGTEVPLYSYTPKPAGWALVAGGKFRHLLEPLPGIDLYQQHHPTPTTVAWPPAHLGDGAPEPTAGTPGTAYRRTFGTFRDARCHLLQTDRQWQRIRLLRPDPSAIFRLGMNCLERGIYETWAQIDEMTEISSSQTHHEPGSRTRSSPRHLLGLSESVGS
ncbi:hypothetical protein GCM10009827_119280 [Dactylosporangium maewongense]|uniref:Uncharacterized protein n=1 Tax=Dactylosporangium maewongense TaxID=634393 RepID=A0ABN2DHH6_9ACTN